MEDIYLNKAEIIRVLSNNVCFISVKNKDCRCTQIALCALHVDIGRQQMSLRNNEESPQYIPIYMSD